MIGYGQKAKKENSYESTGNAMGKTTPHLPPPYLPTIQTLEKDDTNGPHIHLVGDLWRFLTNHKAFRRQVPGQSDKILFSYYLC